MAAITNILDKLWKKFYHLAVMYSKEDPQHLLDNEYYIIFNILDDFKVETRKTIETIRKSLHHTRPMIISADQMENYMKRIGLANEIILNLEDLMKKTFNTYIHFMNTHWETKENFETVEQQRLLMEKYDMPLTEWQFILSKIDRFNEEVKGFI